jgi:KaiC/GvpD/RAD55 family RecA-like ATPase/5S rRNA maturation endonuclease (ribonuclease M5)
MASDNKTEYLKTMLSRYLTVKHGIDIRKPFKCLNPSHDDQHPSMSYYDKGNLVKCFSCGATYDLFDLIGIDYGLHEFKAQKAQAEALYPTGIIDKPLFANQAYPTTNTKNKSKAEAAMQSTNDNTASTTPAIDPESFHQHIHQTTYFQDRGISQEVIDRFKLGYDPSTKQVIMPVKGEFYIRRSTDPMAQNKDRYRLPAGIKKELFNAEALSQKKPVFITEGIIDALSIITAGHEALALPAATDTNLLKDEIQKRIEAQSLPELILCLDNDEAGQKAAHELSEYLKKNKLPHSAAIIPKEYKDANGYLKASKSAFKGFLSDAIEGEDNTSLSFHVLSIQNANNLDFYIPTGFDKLDSSLDRGLYEGLIVLGAIPSLGKTTFALQMALQMAEAGNHVYFYSLEQSARELTIKLLSNKMSKPIADIRRIAWSFCKNQNISEQDYNEFVKASDSLHKLNNFRIIERCRSAEAIAKDVQRRYYRTGEQAMIIIDYLQILETPGARLTDKQAVDQNITALKRLSADFHVPVMAISNLNRENYDKDITMKAFKESGGIEYSTDVLLGMQFTAMRENKDNIDLDQLKAANPRKVQIKILKNRNGQIGKPINFDYNAMLNQFQPVDSIEIV